MSNLLDKASILLTPTAYNDGSMLSIKPENGDGDFDFSRSSAATRVNAQGLVENVQIISSELVSNGDFSQIGAEEVLNGNFSQEGSELVTNGDFATDSDWTINDWNISGGTLNGSASTGIVFQNNIGVVVGKTYKVVLEISNYTSGLIRFKVGGASYQNIASEDGVQEFYFVASTTANNILFSVQSAYTGSIDNVSVKEVGQNWTLGTGWSIGEDKAISDGTINQSLLQPNLFTIGKFYKINFTISDVVGSLDARIWMATGGAKIEVNANGNYTTYWQADGINLYTTTLSTNTATYSITNISVKEVGQDWTLGAGWSVDQANSKAVHDSSAGATAMECTSLSVVVGKRYELKYTANNLSGGYIRAELGGLSPQFNFSSGTYTYNFVATTNANLYVTASADVEVTNISVKEITDDTDLPRIDYTDGCGSWLLEPQSTNLVTYSEDFSLWANGATYTTQNYSVSPSGEQNASRCLFTGADQNIQLSFSNSAETTASIYVKGVSGETIRFGTSFQENNFTLDGTWQRLSITRSVSPYSFAISISTYGGATARDIEIWGAQVENQSYATSYIPTNGASNTRLQDIATNSGNASLINSTEGVLYAEIAALANSNTVRYLGLNDGSSNNRVVILNDGTANRIRAIVSSGGTKYADLYYNVTDVTDFHKVAVKYKVNDFALWIDGVERATDTSGSAPIGLNDLGFELSGGNFYGKCKALAVYKEAKTDANLRCLTYPNPVATTFDLDFDTIAEQFTFTRGSEATFVNEQGLIESTNQLGPELVTNGDFATDSNWSKGPNWTISDGKANSDGSSNGQILQSNVFEANKTYQVTFTATKVSGSGLIARAFYGSYETILSITESGTYTTKFTPNASTNGTLYFISSGLFVGSIDNVSVKEVISATNTPRIDYSTGAKAFLLEPQSTNLITYSEDFSQWTLGSNATLSYESDIVAPDGSLGVYRLTLPAQSSTFLLSNSFTGQNPLALSIYAKSAATNNDFNLFDGSITSSLKTATSEWQRFDYIGTGSQLGIVNQGDTFITDIYIWGAQSEALSYATSYIPTDGASATRNQELCLDATPVINSTEGTLYAEIAALVDGGSTRSISLNDGTSNVVVIIRYRSDTNQIQYLIKDGINPDVGNTYTLTDSTDYSKVALKYKNNDITFWVNGSKIFTSTSPISLSNLNNLSFDTNGANPFFGNTKGLKYYPKALADVQLEDLTTI